MLVPGHRVGEIEVHAVDLEALEVVSGRRLEARLAALIPAPRGGQLSS